MMGLGPVLGKLRNNLIAVNRIRSMADKVSGIGASNNHSMPPDFGIRHQEHKPLFPPFIRSLMQKGSLTNAELTRIQTFLGELNYQGSWTPDEQLTYQELSNRLVLLNVTFNARESILWRLRDDDPKITATAGFAVAEFNKQKNAQLRFIRAVKGFRSYSRLWFDYFLTLEAVDDHLGRTYQAVVKENLVYPHKPFKVLLFGLVADNGNGNLLNLIDNRWSGPYGECLYDDRGFTFRVGDYKLKPPMKIKRCSLEGDLLSSLHML
ncbi:uncharacterized protein LOC112201015 [Rosa chinensis]|uniref:uncharacterized protein LOC112201015 n=1 Tax=Rosa chinensis TaxID=74649 RepID=UPI000D090E8E|nr:uncharacterized protein LOC112201015 [Rosa chinensis]XP_024197793.1 uncharacterized protein LOC112201015 [Rosa chinensis]